jgi:hypothetical protein
MPRNKYYSHWLDVYRVGPEPLPDREVWAIERVDGGPIDTFTYGVAPSGWKTTKEPAPLEQGKFYPVEDSYFRCSGTMPNGSCSLFTDEQFREMHITGQ